MSVKVKKVERVRVRRGVVGRAKEEKVKFESYTSGSTNRVR